MWLIWTVVAYSLNAIAILVDKSLFYTKQIKRPVSYVVVICTLGLTAFVLAPLGLVKPTVIGWAWSMTAGLFFVLALWSMFTALQRSEASRITPFIGAWSPVFVLLISYFLIDDKLSWSQFIAFILLVIGGFLMVGGRGGINRDVQLISLFSALSFAMFYVASKQSFMAMDFISGLLWIRIAAFIFALFLLLIPNTWSAIKDILKIKTEAKLAFLGGQLAAALSALVVNYAISLGSVSLVNALQGLQYVFLLVLVILFSWKWPGLLSEESSGSVLARKLVAIVLIGSGLSILAFV